MAMDLEREDFVPGVLEALERERSKAPEDWTLLNDEDADALIDLTLPIFGLYPKYLTQMEPHKGFVLVWNYFGLWKVVLADRTMTKVA